jgi:hypothetical protein
MLDFDVSLDNRNLCIVYIRSVILFVFVNINSCRLQQPIGFFFHREAIGKILARGHSRVPVYSGNPRNIIGLLLVRFIVAVDYYPVILYP